MNPVETVYGGNIARENAIKISGLARIRDDKLQVVLPGYIRFLYAARPVGLGR